MDFVSSPSWLAQSDYLSLPVVVWVPPYHPGYERLLTSDNPGGHSNLNSLFTRLLGNAKCEKLSHTGSEVWRIPHAKLAHLKERLVSLGIKFAVLREDWNHILRRNTTPMSAAEKEMLAKAGRSRETVGVAFMRAPEAAVAEYALTENPEQGNSLIVVPFSDDKQISLVRTSVTRTDKGVIWRGKVADTGETAILQWWKDGRLNGLFGFRGHTYVVMNMGGDLRAVLEVDPKMMPPDHPTMDSGDVHRSDASMWPLAQAAARPALPKIAPISSDQLKALEAKKIVIDVMMLYTNRAASHYMMRPEDVLELAFERVNDTFRNSGIENVSVRLVHAQAVVYDERGSEQFVDLYRMVDGDVPFKDIRRLATRKKRTLSDCSLTILRDAGFQRASRLTRRMPTSSCITRVLPSRSQLRMKSGISSARAMIA